jgi:myo-inositol 2-dehydrogenase / D-chiro-inositol 1-dehydrogenase
MTSRALGVGVIGAGVMGASHARMIAAGVPGARVAAVYDFDVARAGEIAAEVGAMVSGSALELIADPAVEAVIIAAPDALHEEMALACVAAQKPVLCEKPLATSAEGSRRVVDAEVAVGRRLIQVGFMRRFDPAFLELRGLVESGGLGRPSVVHCLHRNVAAHPDATSDGVVSNSMIHELDHVPWLLDEPIAAITVLAPPAKPGTTLRATQVAILEMASGALATVEVSVNAGYGYDVQCEILGDSGSARLAAPYGLLTRSNGVDGAVVSGDFVARFAEAYRVELVAWTASLRSGVPVGASAWDGHVATRAAAAGVISLNSGARVMVDQEPVPTLYQ